MGLLDEIKQLHEPTKNCIVSNLLASLDADDRKELVAAIGNATIQTSKIVVVLKRRGHKISEKSMWKHRRNGCTCDVG